MGEKKHTYININGYNTAQLIFSYPSDKGGSYSFEDVIDDFKEASVVRICSFNISEKTYDHLLKKLYNLSKDVKLKIVVGLPGSFNLEQATKNATSYLKVLNKKFFKSQIDISINLKNHAKIVSTENICYLGSQNYSYGSYNNYEAGIILTDKKAIHEVFKEFDKIFDSGVKYSLPKAFELANYMQLMYDLQSSLFYLDDEFENEIKYLSSEDLIDINTNSLVKLNKLKKETSSFLEVIKGYKLPDLEYYIKDLKVLVEQVTLKKLTNQLDYEYIDFDEDFGIPRYYRSQDLRKLKDNYIEDSRFSDLLNDLICIENKEAKKKLNEIENKIEEMIKCANDNIDSIVVNTIINEE